MVTEQNTIRAGAQPDQPLRAKNLDEQTVAGFGLEWSAFDQSTVSRQEQRAAFEDYFFLFPWKNLSIHSVGADIGCGSGRWARFASERVGRLLLCDPSEAALAVARKNLQGKENLGFHLADAGNLPVEDSSLDFAYSLGVLHHVPDTALALQAIAKKMKKDAPLLVYLYYAFDDAPLWFRLVWKATDAMRGLICKLPFGLRKAITDLLALSIYWPMARAARGIERLTGKISAYWPLAYYRNKSFYVMRTDSLDRFGTKLEQRFTKEQITKMLVQAGFKDVQFSPLKPLWTAICYRA